MSLTVVAGPRPPVLVGYVAPTEVGDWPVRNDADSFEWINRRLAHGAEVGPIIAEVENVNELLTRPKTGQFGRSLIKNSVIEIELGIQRSDACRVAKLKLVQVRSIPSGKSIVNRGGELGE